jgi:hypothetical protein
MMPFNSSFSLLSRQSLATADQLFLFPRLDLLNDLHPRLRKPGSPRQELERSGAHQVLNWAHDHERRSPGKRAGLVGKKSISAHRTVPIPSPASLYAEMESSQALAAQGLSFKKNSLKKFQKSVDI